MGKSVTLRQLLRAAVPVFAVATCSFATFAMHAPADSNDEGPTTDTESASTAPAVTKSTHFVQLNRSNEIIGRLRNLGDEPASISDARIHFVQNGQAVAVAESVANGRFKIAGLQPGRYSVVIASPDGLAAYAVSVLPFDGQATELSLDSAPIPDRDFPVVRNLLRSEVDANFCSRREAVTLEPVPEPKPIPKVKFQQDVVTTSFRTVSPVELPDPQSVGPASALLHQRPVSLTEDGALNGRIQWLTTSAPHNSPASEARVSLIRDGEVVQVATTNTEGVFTMAGVEPGMYSVVATCPSQMDGGCEIVSGACCSAVECVPQAYTGPCCPQFDAALIGCSDMSYAMDTLCDSACNTEAVGVVEQGTVLSDGYVDGAVGFGGGGYYGGGGGGFIGGGGGGAGFGGGGIGALGPLLGAGLGVGGAALLDDDDDSRGSGLGGSGPISSPAVP